MQFNLIPVKTRIVHPPRDNISDIIDALDVEDGDIIFITSKILGIASGCTEQIGAITKEALIQREATHYLPHTNPAGGFNVNLTISQNILIPAAGVDESNADGYYVCWPHDMDDLCRRIRAHLIKKHGIKRLGVVATDSHTTPLRWGVTGITVGLAGVEPLRDIRGKPDLFGRPMEVTKVNLIDPLTSLAVLSMGESTECTPIAILRGYDDIPFSDTASMADFKIDPAIDLYSPLLAVLPPTALNAADASAPAPVE